MNVLFITGDQWRASCLSSAGHPLIKTPNLDKLASKGVRFASHYTQSTPCGPSRSCLHTSTYIHSNSAFDNGSPMTANLTNWANELTNNGYTPKLIGYVDTVELELSDPKVAKNPDNLLWDGGNLKARLEGARRQKGTVEKVGMNVHYSRARSNPTKSMLLQVVP